MVSDMNDVNYRWLDGISASTEEWDRVESLLATRGWASINRRTSRILFAENAKGELLGFEIFQMVPYVGPLWVRPSERGSGLAEDLSDRMLDFMTEIQARGWLVTAESPYAEKLCVDRGMTKVVTPVYVMVPFGGVEV
jgi:hypothetical protein